MRGLFKIAPALFCLLFCLRGKAQDVESFIKSDPFKFSGSISVGTSFYNTNRPLDNRSPFSYFIQGTPTFSFYGVKVPVSLSIRDSQFSYSSSISRIGINPSYKWVQLYFGANAFQFSPYVLSGQTISGYGIKLTPGKFSLTAFKGKMTNFLPQQDSLIYGSALLPTYQRDALGMKVGFNSKKGEIDLMLFKAADNPLDSLGIPDAEQQGITPEENLTIGLKTKAIISSIFSLGLNLGTSVFTGDQTNDTIQIEEQYQSLSQTFIQPRKSTRVSLAGDAFAQLNLKTFAIGLKVKQVEPLYRTLGLFYIQDDYRNITLNSRISLARRKLNLSGSYGIQQNNLRNTRKLTNKRNISSIQLSYNSGAAFGITANYANYSQDQEAGFVDVADTLRYAQVSKNMSVVPRLRFSNELRSQTFIMTFIQFQADDLSTFYEEPQSTNTKAMSLTYNLKWKTSGFGIKMGSNFNDINAISNNNQRYGGTLGLSKKFNKKSNISLSTTYNLRTSEGLNVGSIINNRISFRLRPAQKQRIALNANYVIRNFSSKESVNDLRANLSYSISF